VFERDRESVCVCMVGEFVLMILHCQAQIACICGREGVCVRGDGRLCSHGVALVRAPLCVCVRERERGRVYVREYMVGEFVLMELHSLVHHCACVCARERACVCSVCESVYGE